MCEHCAALEIALRACAEDLEAEINARYAGPHCVHPGQQRRYDRDMEPVKAAYRLLA